MTGQWQPGPAQFRWRSGDKKLVNPPVRQSWVELPAQFRSDSLSQELCNNLLLVSLFLLKEQNQQKHHQWSCTVALQSHSQLGQKRPLWSSIPATNLVLPKPSLIHAAEHHTHMYFKYLQRWCWAACANASQSFWWRNFPNIQSHLPLAQLEATSCREKLKLCCCPRL